MRVSLMDMVSHFFIVRLYIDRRTVSTLPSTQLPGQGGAEFDKLVSGGVGGVSEGALRQKTEKQRIRGPQLPPELDNTYSVRV